MVENAGQRGIAALVKQTEDGIAFVQQSRGVAFEDESKLGPIPGAPDMMINLSSATGLRFCPLCGCRLQELAEASPREFQELAEQHEKFLPREDL